MKGVILCAGRGTRMQPFSSFLPKTLCPVANQPLIDYCIQKLVEINISQVAIVLNRDQDEIRTYLKKYSDKVQIQFILQDEPKGIADAVRITESFIGDDSFIVLLGDNLIVEPLDAFLNEFVGYEGTIMLSRVENPKEYGIAEIQGSKIVHLEEKPKVPKSNLAVVGIYGFTPTIFKAVANIQPSNRGEYEITDAVQWLIDHDYSVSHSISSDFSMDVGTIHRWLAANKWMLRQKYGESIVLGNNVQLENCHLRGPVAIGNNCAISNATVGPYVSIQDECTLMNCTIEQSICLEKSKIMHVPTVISNSVFGRESILKLNSESATGVQYILSDRSQVVST